MTEYDTEVRLDEEDRKDAAYKAALCLAGYNEDAFTVFTDEGEVYVFPPSEGDDWHKAEEWRQAKRCVDVRDLLPMDTYLRVASGVMNTVEQVSQLIADDLPDLILFTDDEIKFGTTRDTTPPPPPAPLPRPEPDFLGDVLIPALNCKLLFPLGFVLALLNYLMRKKIVL